MMGMGGHQSASMLKDEWLTPPDLLSALGQFDTDPCSPINRPWPTAAKHLTVEDDGLSCQWFGRVWLNPPYGSFTGDWLEKLAAHGNGIALIFARTETEFWFKWVWEKADAVLFLRGRLHFHHVSGQKAKHNAGAPSALVAYGVENVYQLRDSKLEGKFVPLWPDKYVTQITA